MPPAEPFIMMQPVSLTVDLIPILLLVGLFLSGSSLIAALPRRASAQHGLCWAVSGAMAAMGLLLIFLRGSIPDVSSILFGNWFLITGEAMFAYGTSRYIGRCTRVDVAAWGAALTVFACAYFAGFDVLVRVTIYSLACIFFAIRSASAFIQARRTALNLAAALIATLVCLVEMTRLSLGLADVISVADKSNMNSFSMLFGVPVSLMIAVGAFIMQRDHLTEKLRFKPVEPQPEKAQVDLVATPAVWVLLSDRAGLVTPDGTEIRLTGNEYMVLQKLGEVGDAVDRLTLNATIGRSTIDPKDRGIDILFSRLRRKCSDAGVELPINALRGRGYVFLGVLQRR